MSEQIIKLCRKMQNELQYSDDKKLKQHLELLSKYNLKIEDIYMDLFQRVKKDIQSETFNRAILLNKLGKFKLEKNKILRLLHNTKTKRKDIDTYREELTNKLNKLKHCGKQTRTIKTMGNSN